MVMSSDDLANSFSNGLTKGRASSMFIEDNVIYSWGYHFPIAVRLSEGTYLLNTDKYSSSTSTHQTYVKRAIVDYIEVDTKTIKQAVSNPSAPIIIERINQHTTLSACMDNIKSILKEKGIKRVPIKKWTSIIQTWSVAKAINVE
jgi:hypothetical protein